VTGALHRRAPRSIAMGAGAAALLLLWALVAGDPAMPLAGWLVGLLFWLGIALGAFLLLATHALTGGAWLEPLHRVLVPTTATLPLFLLLAAPLLIDPAAILPWLSMPDGGIRDALARWYLNLPGFVLRGGFALSGWSLLGVLLVRGGARRAATGAAALLFHAVAITAIGLDWVLSLDPQFRSTVFAAALSLTQVLSALAWCGLLAPEPPGSRGRAGDLAQITIAAALGSVYLGFAQYLVAWYGNLPHKAAWFLAHERLPWGALEIAALMLAGVLPVAALLPGRMRRDPRGQAWIGAGVLLGVACHTLWLIGPPFGVLLLPAGVLGLLAVGGIWLAVLGRLAPRVLAGWDARADLAQHAALQEAAQHDR